MSPECRSSGKTRLSVDLGFTPAGPQEVTRAEFSEKILWPPRPLESSPAQPTGHAHWNSPPPPHPQPPGCLQEGRL